MMPSAILNIMYLWDTKNDEDVGWLCDNDLSYEIIDDKDEGGFIVCYPDLSGCITYVETLESAIANAVDA